MRNSILRIIYSVVVFMIALVVMEVLLNRGNSSTTAEMAEATLPVVTLDAQGVAINELHGYVRERDISEYRGVITPLAEDRLVNFSIAAYDNEITSLSFEVRTVSGSRLVESTEIVDYETAENGDVTGSFRVKDLISDDTEYMLVLLVQTRVGSPLRFYSRIVKSEDNFSQQKINFVHSFHANTFSKTASTAISTYIEPTAEGNNSDYAHVDIHSSYGQITWGDLKPTEVVGPKISILDMQKETASFRVDFMVTAEIDGKEKLFACHEFYRIKRGDIRINMLSYERVMEEIFDPEATNYTADTIPLGITGSDLQFTESDGGAAYAFVNAGRLYAGTTADVSLAYVFGFPKGDSLDARDNYWENGIKILNVEETGNINFLLYGYMNRGKYEGELGLAVCNYNSVYRTVEELAFIPYTKSFDLLEEQVRNMSYMNSSGTFYTLLDETLYKISLVDRRISKLVTGLTEENYQVSDSGQMICYMDQNSTDSEQMLLMDLSTEQSKRITAGTGDKVKPLGFIGEDLIYGNARKNDYVTDATGNEIEPMYNVVIVDSELKELEKYQISGYYVTGCEVDGNQIVLHRVVKKNVENANTETVSAAVDLEAIEEARKEALEAEKEAEKEAQKNSQATQKEEAVAEEVTTLPSTVEASLYETTEDDQIVNAEKEKTGTNVVEIVTDEQYKTLVQIHAKGVKTHNVKYIEPKLVLYEGSRQVAISEDIEEATRFLVYNTYGCVGVFTDAARALQTAENMSGVVVNEKNQYIWIKANRYKSNQIMAIEETYDAEGIGSIAVCLNTVLSYEGLSTSGVSAKLREGKTIKDILEEEIKNACVMDLTGCKLDTVLYFVNQDIPVIATIDGGKNAVLLVGFNENEVVLMNPQTGTLYKQSRTSTEKLFAQAGNGYVTYIKATE